MTPSVPKPSKKRKPTQDNAESDSFKVEQSTLLKFPVMTVFTGKKKGSKKGPKDDVQMSTLLSSSSTLTSPVEENGQSCISYMYMYILYYYFWPSEYIITCRLVFAECV